jgi:hypothetical protein
MGIAVRLLAFFCHDFSAQNLELFSIGSSVAPLRSFPDHEGIAGPMCPALVQLPIKGHDSAHFILVAIKPLGEIPTAQYEIE